MKKYFLAILSILFPILFGWSQTTTVYKNLVKKKFYSVGTGASTRNGKTTYTVNGKTATKAQYKKYHSTWENLDNCCPCILQFYNEQNELTQESVQCTDCGIGYIKKFHKNGKLRVYGMYKENANIDQIHQEHLNNNYSTELDCHVENGEWIYFSEKGDTLYKEYWDNGQFIKQVPEQSRLEIWNVRSTLDGMNVDEDTLDVEDVNRITFTPEFKNSNITGANLKVKIHGGAIGYRGIETEIPMDKFPDLDLKKLLEETGIPKGIIVNFTIIIENNDQYYDAFSISVAYS